MSEFLSEQPEDEELARFQFSKSVQLTDQERAAIVKFAEDYIDDDDNVGEPKLQDELSGAITFFIINQISWARERLGLDLVKRIPKIQKIRFLSSEDEKKEFIRTHQQQQLRTDAWSGEHRSISNIIILPPHDIPEQQLANLNHELVHNFANQVLIISYDKVNKIFSIEELNRTGLAGPKDAFDQLNEFLTETIKIEMLGDYDQRFGTHYLTTTTIGYDAGVFLLDILIDHAARSLNMGNQQLRKKLYQGYFKGDLTVLRVFGKDHLKALAQLEIFGLGEVDEDKVMTSLGLDTSEIAKWRQMCAQYYLGEPVTLSNGIVIKRLLRKKRIQKIKTSA